MEIINVQSETNFRGFARLYPGINEAVAAIKKLERNIYSNPATKEAALENKRIHDEIQNIILREPFNSRVTLNKRWPNISR